MDPLDFEGKTSNEVLEELATSAEWLALQYAAAKAILPTEIAETAINDPHGQYFWNADRAHLRVLAACTRHLINTTPSPL